MRPFMTVLATAILVYACTSNARLDAAAPEGTAASADDPFGGKIALVLLADNAGHSYLLDTRVAMLGDRTFITGRPLDPRNGESLKGVSTWLPMDSVQRITLFDDQAALNEQLKQTATNGNGRR